MNGLPLNAATATAINMTVDHSSVVDCAGDVHMDTPTESARIQEAKQDQVCNRVALSPWIERIRNDAALIWTCHQSKTVWLFYERDSDQIAKSWCSFTIDWVDWLLQCGTGEKRLKRKYQRYVTRFIRIKDRLRKQMRLWLCAAAIEKYASQLCDASDADFCRVLSECSSYDEEEETLIYIFLRERPDIVRSPRVNAISAR